MPTIDDDLRRRRVLDDVVDLVRAAGDLTMRWFRSQALAVERKADGTPVTEADRAAERFLRVELEARFPGDGIVGEEELDRPGTSGAVWVIDPIDGTKAFFRGVPLYAVLIGLEIEGTVQVGVAYFPALDEMIAAASGQGCWWNGRPARVSALPSLERAAVAHGDVGNLIKYGRAEAWDRIVGASYFRAGWGDAYGHMLVATGRAELMLDPIMSPWDCAPFPPILQEAGGYFGDWQGNATIYGREALSAPRQLLPEVLGLIRGPAPEE